MKPLQFSILSGKSIFGARLKMNAQSILLVWVGGMGPGANPMNGL